MVPSPSSHQLPPFDRSFERRCGKPILNLKAQQDYISHKNHRPKTPQEFLQALKQRQQTNNPHKYPHMDNNNSHTSETPQMKPKAKFPVHS
ncbi:hypothetical protein PGT21_034689 [Puccinia graminis f. sp. tritici]|uniref:Uncharacterized protein n=1 Tax=Puccinia graminis f. sp. tritici TaxID=56615 RepID=A0A5B0NUI0_PUCGR|nr:hypothetical protein PGT21_034689 [Puccinia graminis f. sp. tritici]